MKRNLIISTILIALIFVSRLVPHTWNVAPVAAAALLAGAVLPRKWALSVPILGMLLGDLVIGFYYVPVMLTVYACFAASVLLGTLLKDMKPIKILSTTLASSTLFFIVTNFAVWASADWYEKSWSGLSLCYALAIPFFRNTMLGDLFFTGILFSSFVLIQYADKNMLPQLIYGH